MKTNKLIAGIVGAAIAIIVVAGVLMPVINDAQTTMGDPITYTNSGETYGELMVTDDVSGTHTIVMDAGANTITYDGDVITTATRGYLVVTDAIIVVNTGSYMTICYGSDTYQFNASWGNSYDITFEDGTATMIRTSGGGTQTTFTKDYTWIGYKVASGGNFVNSSSTQNRYTHGVNSILAAGYYSSGDNDTFYIVKDGNVSITDTTYTASIALSSDALVSGTTDINNSYPIISVDDETYTPYVWAVEKEINGHQTAGASYELLGAIPLLTIVAVLLGVVAVFILRRE